MEIHQRNTLLYLNLKENAQFIFLCNPQKASVNVCLKKILKNNALKIVIAYFYTLGEENF